MGRTPCHVPLPANRDQPPGDVPRHGRALGARPHPARHTVLGHRLSSSPPSPGRSGWGFANTPSTATASPSSPPPRRPAACAAGSGAARSRATCSSSRQSAGPRCSSPSRLSLKAGTSRCWQSMSSCWPLRRTTGAARWRARFAARSWAPCPAARSSGPTSPSSRWAPSSSTTSSWAAPTRAAWRGTSWRRRPLPITSRQPHALPQVRPWAS